MLSELVANRTTCEAP